MSSSLLQHRTLCINCHITASTHISRQSCRAISARSAINKGLRASKDEGGHERGGRDRSQRFASSPRFSRDSDNAPRRASISELVERIDRDRNRGPPPGRSRFAHERTEQIEQRGRNEKSFSSRLRDDSRPPRRESHNEPRGSSFPSRLRDTDDSRPTRHRSFNEPHETSFSSRRPRDASEAPRRERFRERNEQSFRSRSTEEPRNASRNAQAEDGDLPPKAPLLREIKTACKLIKTIQERQANGEGIDGLKLDAKASLERINSFMESATFKDDNPQDAIAYLLRKKAAEGTFVTRPPPKDGPSIIFQKKDGTLGLVIGRGDAVWQAKPSRKVEEDDDEPPRYATRPDRNSRFERPQGRLGSRQSRPDEDEDDGFPVSVPYSTAASQFLYGYNAVLAALRAQRRKVYKLYIHPKIYQRESERETDASRGGVLPAQEFVSLAKAAKIPFQNEFNTRILDKMSEGRPHNGLVLEVSKLPAPPVVSLGKPNMKRSSIPLILGRQTAEEAAVNGSPISIATATKSWRYPLVVLLDGITDPGNIGNILRSCHFYGVDAVAVAVNTCANLSSAVLAKASSGACEVAPILSISQPSNFIFESSKARWKVFAAVAPSAGAGQSARNLTTAALAADSPLAKHPCILMFGAEGEGLRENLKNRADQFVSIVRGSRSEDAIDVGVDSMNVSVAAGVLLESFFRKPEAAPEVLEAASELGF